jgi:PD-(D/E)XK endonuclease
MLADQMIKAEIAMMKVWMRALQLGAFVSKPIFEGARYDYLNLRKQIKKDKNCPYNENEVDALVVYVPKIDKVCWFSPEVFCGKQGLSIRISPAKNGQIKGCLAAEDYLW